MGRELETVLVTYAFIIIAVIWLRWEKIGPILALFTAPIRSYFMSRIIVTWPEDDDVAAVAEEGEEAATPIATPCNNDNEALPRNPPATPEPLPEEARAIIRQQAKAEAVAALLRAKKLTNMAEAIELVFSVSRNSRAGSAYMLAKASVEELLSPVGQRRDGVLVERATGEPLFRGEAGLQTREGRVVEGQA